MKDEKVQNAIKSIRQFQKKTGTASRFNFDSGDWKFEGSVIRLAVEGMVTFAIAFMCGKGVGVLYEVMAAAFFGS